MPAWPGTNGSTPESIDPERGIELPADYLRRTGYRLPNEAEWEYAARAGTTTSRHFGDDDQLLSRYGWYEKRERAFPVGQLQPNQWGLFDMLSNVWEWTLDRRQPYPTDGRDREDVEDSVLRVSNDVARRYEEARSRMSHSRCARPTAVTRPTFPIKRETTWDSGWRGQ